MPRLHDGQMYELAPIALLYYMYYSLAQGGTPIFPGAGSRARGTPPGRIGLVNEEQAGVPLIPFDLPEGYLEAAGQYWAGRSPDVAYIHRVLGLPEEDGQ